MSSTIIPFVKFGFIESFTLISELSIFIWGMLNDIVFPRFAEEFFNSVFIVGSVIIEEFILPDNTGFMAFPFKVTFPFKVAVEFLKVGTDIVWAPLVDTLRFFSVKFDNC